MNLSKKNLSKFRIVISTLFCVLLTFSFFTGSSQIQIDSDVTQEITVNGPSGNFELVLINNFDTIQNNVQVKVTFPTGISYVPSTASSVSGHTIAEVNLGAGIFEVTSLNAGETAIFNFEITANCDAIDFQLAGSVFRNQVEVNSLHSHTSSPYNILYAALSITDITPKNTSLVSGQIVTRTITIVNGGNGAINNYVLTHAHGSEITITASSKGILSGDTISLVAADFSDVGDNDGLFEQDEIMSFDITYEAISCTDKTVTSNIKAGWLADEGFCQNSQTFANTAIDFSEPNLKITTSSELKYCLDQSILHAQSVSIENKGSGVAANIVVDIFKSSGGAYDQDLLSKFDLSSITYSLNGSAPVPMAAVSSSNTSNSGNLACLGSNAKGQFILNLQKMDPDDIVVFNWNMKTCDVNVCNGPSVGGWAVDLDYNDICAGTSYSSSANGQSPSEISMDVFNESEPQITDGETEAFTFIISSFENSFENGANSKIEVSVSIPKGLKLAQSSDFFWTSAPNTWSQDSFNYNQSSGELVATFMLPHPFTLSKSEITLLLTADCSMNGASSGSKDIELDINLIRDNTCANSDPIPLICDQVITTLLHCPTGNCNAGGIRNTSFNLTRTSFGQPDANEDGYADGSGSIDLTKVKTNRIMVGDTFTARMQGVVHTTNSVSSWSEFFAEVKFPKGSNYESIGATINHNGVTSYSSSVTSSSQSDTTTFILALSGVNYIDNDNIDVTMNFKVTGNIGGTTIELTSTAKMYTSTSAVPSENQKKYCNQFIDNITLIGYYYYVNSRNNVTVTGCSRSVNQYFYLSIGSCCNNYNGGNLFPYEYRNWSRIATAKLVLPTYYSINYVTLNHYSTRGTNRTLTQTVNNITNDYRNQDTLIYNLAKYFTSGDLQPSDDGFRGRLIVNVSPTCDIPYNTFQDVYWAFNFNESEYLTGTTTDWYSINPDRIRYRPKEISLSSSNPVEDGLTKTVTWNVALKNNISNESITQPWLHLISPTGDVQITNVVDLSTGDTLSLTNDLYHLSSLSRSEKRNLEVTATYSACAPEDLISYAGYACNELPQSYSEVDCPHKHMIVEVHPKPTQLQVQIDGKTIGDDCSPLVEVDLLMASVRLGAVDSLELVVTVPSSQSILSYSGENEYSYPNTATAVPFADVAIDGSTYTFPVHQLADYVETKGLPGVTELGQNKIQVSLQFEMQQNFIPGDFLQFSFNSKRSCNENLPQINLAYDPNISFEETEIAGLTTVAGDNWSASWGDYNNDGYDDLFITDYSLAKSNSLFKNNGDKTFTEITTGNVATDLASSLASSWADYDNDGDLDLFVANNVGSYNFLYNNNGDGSFTKVTEGHIASYDGYSHGATWADYDSDGYLDLFVSDFMPSRVNLLYRNLGDGTFELITSGDIIKVTGHSIGSSWADVDNDGDPDLFVPNAGEKNFFFRNINGELTLEPSSALAQQESSSTGGSWGDYDNDGDLDLFVANASNVPNQLFINDGSGNFTNSSTIVGNESKNTHGSTWTDFDNDGDIDLFTTNDGFQSNQFYTNNGDGTFTVSENDLNKNLENSFGAAASDIENDGDLDLFIVNHSGGENVLFENTKGACQNSFCMTLVGVNSNTSAIGAHVYATTTIYGNSVTQYREVSSQTGGGAGGQNTMKVYFGIGDATQIDLLVIKWPSGIVQQLTNQTSGSCVTVFEESGCLVSGYAYLDANDNCIKDVSEIILANQIIRINDKEVFTDANGFYKISLVDGAYDVAGVSSGNFISTCDTLNLVINCDGINVYDDNNFGFTPGCSSADISSNMSTAAFRRGFGSDLFVNVSNTGGGIAQNVVLKLALPVTFDAIKSSIPWSEEIADTLVWSLGDLSPEQTISIILRDSVTLNSAVGDVVIHKAFLSMNNGTDCDTLDNVYTYSQEVVGAIDPNDKQIEFPVESYSPYIVESEHVRYRIRFQNVGTYYASRVVVIDTLDKQLDVLSIRNITSSHDYDFEIIDDRILKWVFNDIKLPAEEVDEEGSNGFITFEIATSSDMAVGSSISNTAHIQFDFEDFIETNKVENKVLLNRPKESAPSCQVMIRPNPVSQSATISLLGTSNTKEGVFNNPIFFREVNVISANGDAISTMNNIEPISFELSVSDLRDGIYIIQVTDYNGNKYFGKMIKY
jgi:hypothetical protein